MSDRRRTRQTLSRLRVRPQALRLRNSPAKPTTDQPPTYLLPSETIRTHSLQTPHHPPSPSPRGCDSLPPDWHFPTPLPSPNLDPPLPPSPPSPTPDTPHTEQSITQPTPPYLDLLTELTSLRQTTTAQTALLQAALAAQSAQQARLEQQLESIRARELHRARPRPFDVLLGAVADAIAILLLALFSWLIARPVAALFRAGRAVCGWRATQAEDRPPRVRRRSWRISFAGEDGKEDAFLASAAKRLSFGAVAFDD